ncbi:MAG: TFIIB-type zinc ribbon-containing protein [Candidatus Woesearchaeota archaeon]
MAIKLNNVDKCPECGSMNIVYSKSKVQIVCKECGGIFSELSPEQEKQFEKASDVI